MCPFIVSSIPSSLSSQCYQVSLPYWTHKTAHPPRRRRRPIPHRLCRPSATSTRRSDGRMHQKLPTIKGKPWYRNAPSPSTCLNTTNNNLFFFSSAFALGKIPSISTLTAESKFNPCVLFFFFLKQQKQCNAAKLSPIKNLVSHRKTARINQITSLLQQLLVSFFYH